MKISQQLMFTGQAEQAMELYVSLLPGSRIVSIERYGAGEAGAKGSVRHAVFELCGVPYRCIDSPVAHAFTFSPSISLCIEFDTREQWDAAYVALSAEGQILMPAGAYDFSPHFAWVQDRFGVSWQLSLS
jgi:predicted 3-demethylubiquinone-9 3-methyltransferase (glyoxalase superfamily)